MASKKTDVQAPGTVVRLKAWPKSVKPAKTKAEPETTPDKA